jgi:hypothetical protein
MTTEQHNAQAERQQMARWSAWGSEIDVILLEQYDFTRFYSSAGDVVAVNLAVGGLSLEVALRQRTLPFLPIGRRHIGLHP